MVAVAMISLNLFHPGLCFDNRKASRSADGKSSPEMSEEVAMETK
jgi:hypothetical protein